MKDVSFTLDPKQFLEAVTKMTSSLDKMVQSSEKTAQAITKNVGSMTSWMIAKGQMMAQGMIAVAQKVVQTINKNIPEIGQAFDIAGDIISRNLLYPLRTELLPLLNKMLAWVRDHRAMFAAWGAFLVSVFRMIRGAVSSLIDVITGLWEKLSSGIQRIFGKTSATVSDIINLIILKLSILVQVGIQIFGMFADFVMGIFLTIVGYIKDFVTSFRNAFGDISPLIDDYIKVFSRLWDIVKKLGDSMGSMSAAFKTLGAVLGGSLRVGLEAILTLLDSVVTGIEKAQNALDFFNGKIDKAEYDRRGAQSTKEFKERMETRGKAMADAMMRTKDEIVGAWSGGNRVNTSNNNNNATTINDNKKVEININGAKDSKAVADDVVTRLRKESIGRGYPQSAGAK